MIQPKITGKILHVEDQAATFTDRETGKVESYRKRHLHIFQEGAGVLAVRVSGDEALPVLKSMSSVELALSSFSIEKGAPRAGCLVSGIRVIG